jgi:iron complex transport system substrate-binding protein
LVPDHGLGERDRIVGIFGGCVRPPEARREKPQVSAFTSAVASAVCFIAVLGSGS